MKTRLLYVPCKAAWGSHVEKRNCAFRISCILFMTSWLFVDTEKARNTGKKGARSCTLNKRDWYNDIRSEKLSTQNEEKAELSRIDRPQEKKAGHCRSVLQKIKKQTKRKNWLCRHTLLSERRMCLGGVIY